MTCRCGWEGWWFEAELLLTEDEADRIREVVRGRRPLPEPPLPLG